MILGQSVPLTGAASEIGLAFAAGCRLYATQFNETQRSQRHAAQAGAARRRLRRRSAPPPTRAPCWSTTRPTCCSASSAPPAARPAPRPRRSRARCCSRPSPPRTACARAAPSQRVPRAAQHGRRGLQDRAPVRHRGADAHRAGRRRRRHGPRRPGRGAAGDDRSEARRRWWRRALVPASGDKLDAALAAVQKAVAAGDRAGVALGHHGQRHPQAAQERLRRQLHGLLDRRHRSALRGAGQGHRRHRDLAGRALAALLGHPDRQGVPRGHRQLGPDGLPTKASKASSPPRPRARPCAAPAAASRPRACSG